MPSNKTVKNIMIDIFEYPHMPYWFTIDKAIRIIKASLGSKKYPEPMVILIFDEKYNLLGTLTMEDILRGIEPKCKKVQAEEASIAWDAFFTEESVELLKKPVNEIMIPAKSFVEPDDPITRAAYLMIQDNSILLPVLQNKEKLVGLVRMLEIFDEISNKIL